MESHFLPVNRACLTKGQAGFVFWASAFIVNTIRRRVCSEQDTQLRTEAVELLTEDEAGFLFQYEPGDA